MTRDRREEEIRDLISRRQPVPFARANWLLAELDAARLKLAAVELELDDVRTPDVAVLQGATPADDGTTSSRRPEWLTVAAFADAIGIGRSLAYDLVRRGEIKPVRRFGRLVRIHRDALQVAGKRTG